MKIECCYGLIREGGPRFDLADHEEARNSKPRCL
jgi:hypothetical protein